MVNILREGNKNKIVFINAGAFYIAIEEDAVLLNSKLQLKCTCFQKNTCKIGIPINALEKYLVKIEKLGYGYIVYKLDREKNELKVIKEFEGKKNKTQRKNINCLMCKGVNIYKDDEYMEALEKFYRGKLNNVQRIYLRIMHKNRWIDDKKFNIAMGSIYELGKMLGGLIKYYAKNNKK